MYELIRPLLFCVGPEQAHRAVLIALRLSARLPSREPATDPVEVMGLRFPNRVGLAAGFDKNAVAIDGLWRLGFGFIEIGTVTPRAQPGRPRPRLFRLRRQHALINALGFPNDGIDEIAGRLRGRRPSTGMLGVNIGKNADTPLTSAVDDYVACLRGFQAVADYIAVNISSPNTEALRELHEPSKLAPLLAALVEERESGRKTTGRSPPLLLKISPDLDVATMESVARSLQAARFDGVIATNSTVQRPPPVACDAPAGGLSGPPLRELSLTAISRLRSRLGPAFPIIGVGGIDSPATAQAMRSAGADLVQLYTGLVYKGPRLIRQCTDAHLNGQTLASGSTS